MAPQPISPAEISQRSLKLFNPNFKSPRAVRQPTKPNLAWSKLPPPAAELDERPRSRVRRFRLWKEVTPELRKVVLDQRKRFHLRRYQSYAIPATFSDEKRKLLPVPLPRPTRPGLPTLKPNDHEWTWSTPYRDRPRLRPLSKMKDDPSLVGEGGLLTPPLSPEVQCIDDENKDVMQVLKDDGYGITEDHDVQLGLQCSLSGIEGRQSYRTFKDQSTQTDQSEHPSPVVNEPPTISQGHLPSDPSSSSSSYWLPPLPPSNNLPWRNKSIAKRARNMNYQKLLEYKWILDQEHERRFRVGMQQLMRDMMEWQNDHTLPYKKWRRDHKWKEDVDLREIQDTTEFFTKIRKKSSNIFLYLSPKDISQVPFRDRVHSLVKDEEDRKRRKREKKEAKKKKEAQLADKKQGRPDVNNSSTLSTSNSSISKVPSNDTSSMGQSRSRNPPVLRNSNGARYPEETSRSQVDNMIIDLSPFRNDPKVSAEQRTGLTDLIGRLTDLRGRKEELTMKLEEKKNKGGELVLSQSPIEEDGSKTDGRQEKEKERYLDNPIDGSGHIIVGLDMEDVQTRSRDDEDQHFANRSALSKDEDATIDMDEVQVRYGSLNLDDDTALPISSDIPSSAFSRREIEIDLSDESHSSSFEGGDDDQSVRYDILPVKLEVDDEGDEVTITPSVDMVDQRDTLYSGLGGSLTSQITLV
ncbi:hypothetical protein V865_003435 [Kwoniella europaea PYCC6329]|uniref:Uncharacterized protein n=1 Tax=Kwoniella europaea PYCC6329 TaxID=1423913 RepID=A0AAX4KI05_9TREE